MARDSTQRCSICHQEKTRIKAGIHTPKPPENPSIIPPVEKDLPHFICYTTASSLHRLQPTERPSTHQIHHQFEEHQIASSSQELHASPIYHYRGIHSQDSPTHQEARRQRERDRRAHRAAKRAGEEMSPTQDLEIYLADPQKEQDILPSGQLSSSTDPLAAFGSEVFSPVTQSTSLPPYRGHGARPSFSSSSTPRRPLLSNHFVYTACHKLRHHARKITNNVDICQYCQNPKPQQALTLLQSDPPYTPSDLNCLPNPALAESDMILVKRFHTTLEQHTTELCHRCEEKWFNMRLNAHGICDHYVRVDSGKHIYLFSAINNMHPGDLPDLPELSQTEEMLIARVHVCVEIHRVRGQQYKWLAFLRLNHPGYHDIEISQEAIHTLPQDSDVSDQVVNERIEPVKINPDNNTKGVELPERSAVPDILAQEDELTSISITPWAFPTLFPRGEAEFTSPRQRTVPFEDYIKHLMKFHDGRFARHPRFRYVVFNILMRQQANSKAGFFVKQRTIRGQEVTADDLRSAFADKSREGDALISSIIQRSSTLRGTRPFWTNKNQQLKAMVKNISPAHLFLTLSAADLHWNDLMLHLPRYEDSFQKEVLDKKFNVVDFWFRYKWQGRGSVHAYICNESSARTEALLQYIAKYVSKAETKSDSYKDMMKSLLPTLNQKNPFLSIVMKMINRLIGEHDWSAQEVLHLLLNIPLQIASRDAGDDGEAVQRGLSVYEKYKRRPLLFEDITYLHFLQRFDFRKVNNPYERQHVLDRVLNYFPIYNAERQQDDYAHIKLMLHHPFRQITNILTLNGNTFDSFITAYTYCQEACIHENNYYGEVLSQPPESTYEDAEFQDDQDIP
ncbi:hypothetical protein TSTA_001030 [Talaromyces stipitatus ATCC 10500]|uniref:Uncharacterized protein n=1 Tax=Talaromyces stipitatus (strain ATCC 10500 / CBS 375.48 / QM 6759 / NRRL 1006) TaxID=441959 RepID=B8MT07_TALSN|nr:uncharacterized protein TSTA_001030 [Talaromyces stipitatus ATCC 10500]EED12031.1 hypothetical protein TSTA_001030 [Talaromyces stipitatus ATCC 10500]